MLRRFELDPGFRRGDEEEMRGSSPRMTCFSIVIPANASDPASYAETPKLDPDFRQGEEENKGRPERSSLTTFLI